MGQVSSVGTLVARASTGVERAAERRGVQADRGAEQPPVRRGEDRVELTRARTAVPAAPAQENTIAQEAQVRTDLIARVREELASGMYETDARIDGAIDALLNGRFLDTLA